MALSLINNISLWSPFPFLSPSYAFIFNDSSMKQIKYSKNFQKLQVIFIMQYSRENGIWYKFQQHIRVKHSPFLTVSVFCEVIISLIIDKYTTTIKSLTYSKQPSLYNIASKFPFLKNQINSHITWKYALSPSWCYIIFVPLPLIWLHFDYMNVAWAQKGHRPIRYCLSLLV